jgi:hypothetical protein
MPNADGAILWRENGVLVLTPYALADFPILVAQLNSGAGREVYISTRSDGSFHRVFGYVFLGIRQHGDGWAEFFRAEGGGELLGQDYILTQSPAPSQYLAWYCDCSWIFIVDQVLWSRSGESFTRSASRRFGSAEATLNVFLGAAGMKTDVQPGFPCLPEPATAPADCAPELLTVATPDAVAELERLGLSGATITWSFDPREVEEYKSWNALPSEFRSPPPTTPRAFEIDTRFPDGSTGMLRLELAWTSSGWLVTSVELLP